MADGGSSAAVLKDVRALWGAGAVGDLADARLLERFLARSPADAAEAAFAALVERHGAMVLRVAADVLGDPHAAQDAAQAAFLVLARRAGSIRHRESLGAWLHGVAVRVARRAKSEAARRREVERRGAEMKARTVETTPEPCPELHEEIERLPEKYRAPIVLCYLEGHTQEQAARRLGWPLGTVQTRLHRGREALRSRLARRGLGGVIAAGLLARGTPASAAPPTWAGATAKAALRLATGQSAAGLVPAAAIELAEGTLMRLWIGKVTALAAGLMAAGALVAVGAALAGVRSDEPAARPAAKAKAEPDVSKARVLGVVVDEAGMPVAGATVKAVGYHEPTEGVVTAEDGTFSLPMDGPSVRLETLLASSDDGRRLGLSRTEDTNPEKGATVRLVLKPARDLTIRAVDGDGKPVPGASVEVFDHYTPVAVATTDDRGAVRLGLPADVSVFWVIGLKPGVGFDYFENYKSWPPSADDWKRPMPPPAEVALALDGAQSVRVKAVDSDDRPAAGVELTPWYITKPGKIDMANIAGSRLTHAKTDARGLAAFDWIPSRFERTIPFVVHSEAYHCEEQPAFDPAKGRPEVIVPVVRTVRAEGRVTFLDGRPAPGILVQAEGYGDGPNHARQFARTAEDGTYALDLPAEKHYLLAVLDERWAAPSQAGVILREGRSIRGLDFRLGQGTLIRGLVTTEPDDKPAPGQTVTLIEIGEPIQIPERGASHGGHESLVRWAKTDGEGRYAFRVGPGKYTIRGPISNDPTRGPEELTVADERVIGRDFDAPRRLEGVLTGTVVAKGPKAEPVPKALLVARPLGRVNYTGFQAAADESGRFRVGRRAVAMLVAARSPDNSLAGAVEVEEDDERVTIPVAPSATARGRVVDKDGKPVAGARVQCGWGLEPPADGINQGPMYEHAKTDDEGRYAIKGLPVGVLACVSVSQADNFVKSQSFEAERPGNVEVEDIVVDGPVGDDP